MNKTANILFEYLNDIMYRPDKANIDLSQLPDEFQQLGRGMQYFAKCAAEERWFVEALANGYTSVEPPDDKNILTLPLKELQSFILYLTRQTRLVADGDYTQRINASGEFAEAFNSMVEQLNQRTSELITEKKLVEMKNNELSRNAKFMQILANDTCSIIYVFERSTGRQYFANNSAKKLEKEKPKLAEMLKSRLVSHHVAVDGESSSWELQLPDGENRCFYTVESLCSTQEEEVLVVHIIMDDTERKQNEMLSQTDPLTGLHNKSYAMEIMSTYIKNKVPFLMSFVDVDYLKYCNDVYGHECGDNYILRISSMLERLDGTACRIGGDEFLVIREGSDKTAFDAALLSMRDTLMNTGYEPYPRSFSFGTCAVTVPPEHTLSDYLKLADDTMYAFKQKYKKPLDDLNYQDERI